MHAKTITYSHDNNAWKEVPNYMFFEWNICNFFSHIINGSLYNYSFIELKMLVHVHITCRVMFSNFMRTIVVLIFVLLNIIISRIHIRKTIFLPKFCQIMTNFLGGKKTPITCERHMKRSCILIPYFTFTTIHLLWSLSFEVFSFNSSPLSKTSGANV